MALQGRRRRLVLALPTAAAARHPARPHRDAVISSVRYDSPGHDGATGVCQDRRAYVWDNDADTAALRNNHERVVGGVTWGRHRGDHRDGGTVRR
jgi:hypothetical protein